MAAINRYAARWSGTVSYNDGSWSTFHTQTDNGTTWSQDSVESTDTMRQLSWYEPSPHAFPYWSIIISQISALPFIASFDWDGFTPDVQKVITGLNARLDIIFAFDDGTNYPVALVGEQYNSKVNVVRVELPDKASGSSNLAAVKLKLKEMFNLIMDNDVTLT